MIDNGDIPMRQLNRCDRKGGAMNDLDGSTGAGTPRDGDDVATGPALSPHTFTGSADRVALRLTPARGDAAPGAVEVIDAASLPVGTTAPPAEIVVRQLYPDTVVPVVDTGAASSRTPPPPGPLPLPGVQGRVRGGKGVFRRRVWLGMAAIIIALTAIALLVLQSFGRTADAVLPSASAPAIVGAPATPAPSLAPVLAPPPSSVLTAVPPTSIPSTATAVPLATAVPTAAPVVIATVEPTTLPITAPTAVPPTSVPPTSVPNAPSPPPAVNPAAPPPQGAVPAGTVSLPASPRLPPAIPLPATNIPSVPQVPRKPPVP